MKNLFKGGVAVFALCGAVGQATAASVSLDDFDTFTSPGTGVVGFNITDTTNDGLQVNDGLDVIPAADTFFSAFNLQRLARVNIPVSSSSGDSTLQNGLPSPGPVYSYPGKVSFSNDVGVTGTATLQYILSAGQDLTPSWDRFSFIFDSSDFGGTITASISTGAGLPAVITATVPSLIAGSTPVALLFANATGNTAALDSAKIITFTLTPSAPAADWVFDALVLDNPNIPEASTTLPALAFAGLMGGWAWRRAKAKKA